MNMILPHAWLPILVHMAAKVIMMGTGSDYKGRLHELRPIRDKDSVDGTDILQDPLPLIYTV